MELQMPRSDYNSSAPVFPNATHHGFDPNQPRVPAGHSDGGQWTRTPGAGAPSAPRREVTVDRTGSESWGSYVDTYRPDGSLAEQRVFNRDGSRIVSEFKGPDDPGDWDERHTVTMRDGRKVTFETAGNIQRIYDGNGRLIGASEWTKDGPEALPIVQPVLAPAIAAIAGVAETIELALVLFTWLSSRNTDEVTAALGYAVTQFQPGAAGKLESVWVGRVTQDQLKATCPEAKTVQEKTNEAANSTNRSDYPSPSQYGTAVHKRLEGKIKGLGNKNLSPEVSLLKTLQETGEKPNNQIADYGQKGSVRIDVLENNPETQMVCVYDIKTGKRGLYPARIAEIARAVYFRYPESRGFFVIEMRPR
jgi:hypothetical protein